MLKIQTERLILRPWNIADATALYKYAKDPEIGENAGWAPHESIDESKEIIKTVFSKPKIYAIVLKGTEQPIGCIGLMFGDDTFDKLPEGEAEIGFWLGKPFWGKGITTEATKAIVAHAFKILNIHTIWGSHYNFNVRSKRVMEKCGFKFHHEAVRDNISTSFLKLEA